MARPTKLTPEVAGIIIQHIRECATYDAAAQAAGIAYSTFRSWMVRGEKDLAWIEAHPNALVLPEQLIFVQFMEGVTRAQGEALTNASKSVFEGIGGAVGREYTRETVTEPARDKSGKVQLDSNEKPIIVERTIEREVVRQTPPDWRAGIAFLERRKPEDWSSKLVIEATLKQVPPDALQLLPELAQLAKEHDMDLATLFTEMLNQVGQERVNSA